MSGPTDVDGLANKLAAKFARSFKCKSRAATRRAFMETLHHDSESVRRTARGLLEPWIGLAEEALFWLRELRDWVDSTGPDEITDERRSLCFALYKAFDDACAFRLLVLSGYDNAARAVFRTTIEALDLTIILLARKDLATEYASEKTFRKPSHEFWNKHLSRGRKRVILDEIVREVHQRKADVHPQMQGQELYGRLSDAVHSSASSAATAWAMPILEKPEMLSTEDFGRVSLYSPGILMHFSDRVIDFGHLFILLILTHLAQFDPVPESRISDLRYISARFNAMAELVENYQKEFERVNDSLVSHLSSEEEGEVEANML